MICFHVLSNFFRSCETAQVTSKTSTKSASWENDSIVPILNACAPLKSPTKIRPLTASVSSPELFINSLRLASPTFSDSEVGILQCLQARTKNYEYIYFSSFSFISINGVITAMLLCDRSLLGSSVTMKVLRKKTPTTTANLLSDIPWKKTSMMKMMLMMKRCQVENQICIIVFPVVSSETDFQILVQSPY